MAKRRREKMSEGKKNIIADLIQEYDIKTAADIQEALKDLLGGTIQEMMEAELDEHLGYEKYERSDNPNYRNGVKHYNKFQAVRARDKNYVGSMFYEGAIERAKSITEGGAKNAIASIQVFGISNVIDSLTVVKQFVYDEKLITMENLISALEANWNGYENLRNIILKKTEFFGNDANISNEMGNRYATSLKEYLKNKKSDLGYKFMLGNLIGYNQHNKWFGDGTKATPDGRYDGDIMNFGIGQSEGKDREGISALLNSVAKLNSHSILCGSTVTNVLLDEQLIKSDNNFEKTVKLFETYLKNGGLHFQLTYVSKEDLKAAKVAPDEYKNLRVRVSGFSDYFVRLNSDLQDEIIERTEKRG